jgi:hypothetical protein
VPGGVTIGSDNYTDNHNLLQVDSPRMSATVDKEAYKLTYADPTFDYRALFEKGFTGTPIQVWIGFYNSLTTSLNGILPGRPVNSYADCILAYQGTVDKTSYAVNMDEESIATMECSSPMGALGFTKSLLTSRDSLNQIDTTDTSFDQIFIGSKGLTLLWGKRQG